VDVVIEGVSHRVGDRTVLDGIDVTLTERRIGVVGLNGSGKSTLARLLNGLVLPTSGRVLVEGLDTARDAAAVRRRVGFVFTDPDAQIVMPTAGEDVAFSLRRNGLSKAQAREQADRVLEAYELGGRADAAAHLLSGGEKQLLALASVLAAEPALVVCDEPTTLLDLRNTRRVGALLAGLDQSVLLVTHRLDELADYERVLVLHEGRLVADDVPSVALDAYRRLAEAPAAGST
jgi:biotin transport system ATP-binding protein